MKKCGWLFAFLPVLFIVAASAYAQEEYGCLEPCHQLSPDPPGVTIITDCVASGCHDTFIYGNHHTTDWALAGTCTVCHDPNLVADYDEDNPSTSSPTVITPTVQNCNNCHKGHISPLDQNGEPYPFPIYNTAILEHMDGQGYTGNCLLCHVADPPNDPAPIKQCETCHTVETLHNIAGHAVTSPDPLPYDGYWYDENGVWAEITENDRCKACHGDPPDPAPATMLYVSQDVGTYDTTYVELTEDDCRDCHGESLADRHHQILDPPPYIDKLKRKRREPGQRLYIMGGNFGNGYLGDYVRIGPKELPHDHNRIIEWTPTYIRVKIPKKKYVKNGCAWFGSVDERKVKVWVNVVGEDSNKKRLTLIKNPADCQ